MAGFGSLPSWRVVYPTNFPVWDIRPAAKLLPALGRRSAGSFGPGCLSVGLLQKIRVGIEDGFFAEEIAAVDHFQGRPIGAPAPLDKLGPVPGEELVHHDGNLLT